MPALTRVVHRRCERRECARFLLPVASGEVCPEDGCGQALAIETKIRPWVPAAAAVAVTALALLAYFAQDLRAAVARVRDSVQASAPPPPPPSAPPPPAAVARDAAREAAKSLSRGEALARQGRYEEARSELARAAASDPGDPVAWANLGAADAKTGRREEARAAYTKALALDPGHWLAHYNLALLLAREGDRDGAVRHLETFFSLVESSPKRRSQAIEDLRGDPSLRLFLTDPRVHRLLGGES